MLAAILSRFWMPTITGTPSRRLFLRAFRKAGWRARDVTYILASFLPAPAFEWLVRLVDNQRSAQSH